MEVKCIRLITPFLLAFSASATANSGTNQLNYDFLYADLSAGSLNENLGVNNNVTALAVGGNYLLADNVLVTFDYSARFIHPEGFTTELYTLLPGVAYRYPIIDKLDLMVGARLGYLWATQTKEDTQQKLFSDDDFVASATLALKYAINDQWEVATQGEINHSDFLQENVFHIRADYQFAQRFTVGGFYTHRDGDFDTAQIKGNASTNEGGVSLRYLF